VKAGKLSNVLARVIFCMDIRFTDAKGKTLGFIRDSGGREIVTDASGRAWLRVEKLQSGESKHQDDSPSAGAVG
jgi:hypothetical protein